MPYANNGEINIYYEVEGEGPPLVMHHGFTSSLEGFRESGFVDALKNDYRIILMDARGHGKSDKPHNPELYTSQKLVSDVVTVLDTLGIGTTSYYGYSFGGGIAYEIARYAPERIKAMIAGGAGAQVPSIEMYEEVIRFLKARMDTIASRRDKGDELSPPEVRLLENDPEALMVLGKAIVSSSLSLNDLPGMNIPFLLFVGELDNPLPVKETSERLPDATFILLPGLDHGQAGSRPDLVVPYIKEFLAGVNK